MSPTRWPFPTKMRTAHCCTPAAIFYRNTASGTRSAPGIYQLMYLNTFNPIYFITVGNSPGIPLFSNGRIKVKVLAPPFVANPKIPSLQSLPRSPPHNEWVLPLLGVRGCLLVFEPVWNQDVLDLVVQSVISERCKIDFFSLPYQLFAFQSVSITDHLASTVPFKEQF